MYLFLFCQEKVLKSSTKVEKQESRKVEKLKSIFRIEIWTFSFQIGNRKQFSTLGSGQTETTQVEKVENSRKV